ncbi:hypothetical protein Tco_1212318 [Tanacetum coccineum]
MGCNETKKTDPNKDIGFSIEATNVHEKTTSPRFLSVGGKTTGRILKTVCLRWFQQEKTFASSQNKVQASVFMAMMSDHNSSDLAPQRQEMSVENVSSGLEAMADSAWDRSNQDELHSVRQTNKSGNKLLPKGYAKEEGMFLKNHLLSCSLGSSSDFRCPRRTQVFSNLSDGVKTEFLIAILEGLQFLGDKLVSWDVKKQNCTAMSSAEAEYVALSASCESHNVDETQLQDYASIQQNTIVMDYQSAIAFSCNPVQQLTDKADIHTRYLFIKEQVENGIIELYFVRTEYQLADMFTKALPEDRFKYLVRRIGMRCLTPAELEVLTNTYF